MNIVAKNQIKTVANGSPSSVAHRKSLVVQLTRLKTKAAQDKFLTKHSALLHADVVAWLTNSVREQAKVNASQAIAYARVGVTIAGRLKDRNAMAQSLRAMGNAFYLSGENKAAVKSHDEARKVFARLRNSTELARTLSASIQPLILTGQYKRAFSAAAKARQIFAAEGNEWRLARLELNTGNIFQRQGQFSEALEHYQKAHRYFLDNPEKDQEALGVALHNVAMCLVCLNDYPGARTTYENARSFATQHGMDVLVGQADYNIALLHNYRGEYSRAVDLLRKSLQTFQDDKDSYHVALCYLDLSEIYLGLNRGDQAEEMAEHAVQDFQCLEMGYESGKALTNLALAKWQQGKTESALELFAKARKQLVDEENRIWPSRVDLYQAILCLEQGRYREARHLCVAAQKAFHAAKVPHYATLCRLLLVQLCLQTGKAASARQYCSAALEQLETLGIPALECQAHQLMGRIHAKSDRLDDAYDSYQNARRILETLRGGLNREELKTSFMKNKSEIYEELVELCQVRTPGPSGLEEAFEYIEESKSRSLRDLMFKAGSEFQLVPNQDPKLHSRIQTIRAEIHWYWHSYEIEQLCGASANSKRLAEIQNEIRKRETDLLRVVREMPIAAAESAGLISPKAVTVSELRSCLSAETTLLEFFQICDRFMALVLTHDSLEIIPLCSVSRVGDLLTRLQFQLSKLRLSPEYARTFANSLLGVTQKHLKDLYDELLAPLSKRISGNHLLIVPHGILHALPFHALYDGQQYLIDSVSVSYAPSATIFSLCHERTANRSGALVLGVADAAVPLILEEARAVVAKLPLSDLYLGADATTRVLQQKGESCAYIHIATHGYFRQDDPMFSGIRMGDGVLSLYDMYQLRLPAQLITLSGCATGLNVVAAGDELLGLARGLIYAGAQTALLTLWDVQDESTAEFMARFYSHLPRVGNISQLGAANRATALQQAMLELRRTYPHPYYWAPFVMLGKVTTS